MNRHDDVTLFHVDHNCYILYTGERGSGNPLVRIGTWKEMPRWIIPFVENIVIPSHPTGDPLWEEECINGNIEENSFIGPADSLERLKSFLLSRGIDISSARSLTVETELPEYSGQKKLTTRDAIAGIFKGDGNFIVTLNGETIFNLNDISTNQWGGRKIHDQLDRQKSPVTDRGSGMVFLPGGPALFHQGELTFLSFPRDYLQEFSAWGIAPSAVSSIVHDGTSLMGLDRFSAWVSSAGKKITIYSQSSDTASLALLLGESITIDSSYHRVFSSPSWYCETTHQGFSFFKTGTDTKLTLAVITKQCSIPLSSIADSHGYIIDSSLMAKEGALAASLGKPVLIYGSYEQSIRLMGFHRYLLYPGTAYSFTSCRSMEEALNSVILDDEVVEPLYSHNQEKTLSIIDQALSLETHPLKNAVTAVNILSLVTFLINTTSSRELAGSLKKIHIEVTPLVNQKLLYERGSALKGEILFFEGTILQIIRAADYTPLVKHHDLITPSLHSHDQYGKILAHRERLKALLSTWPPRKEAPLPEREKKEHETIEDKPEKGKKFPTLPVAASLGVLTIFIIIVIILLPGLLKKKTGAQIIPQSHTPEEQKSLSPTESVTYRFLTAMMASREKSINNLRKRYPFDLSDKAVHSYASQIAVSNGYAPLSLGGIKKKNPHWIYPGTIFVMHDGQKITVSQGDTLWKIAGVKLTLAHEAFYSLYDRYLKAPGEEKRRILVKMKEKAVTEKHHTICGRLLHDSDK